jgi:hypothetical protein
VLASALTPLQARAWRVLLASWIMDVGLYEKEHADELPRDSDLMT